MGILTLIILQMNNTTSDNTQEQPSIITFIKKILSDFNTKLIFILVSLFVLCNAFIMGIIDNYIANGILSGFDDNIAERILFIFVVIVLIDYTVIDIHNNKKVSSSRFGWAFTFLLFWAYYRLFSDEWTYVKFWNINHISYIDIVFVYSISIIIKKSSSIIKKLLCNKKDDANIQGFLVDLPIKEEDSDSLIKRDNIAEELATKIKNTPIEKGAFSIGIESPWGEGKTSFLNLLCNHFKPKDTIIIKFNPWKYEKERNLVDAFFLELRENLKIYDSSLSTNLTEYARILSDSNHDIIKFGAKFIECFSSQSVEAKRDVINSAIKGIGKLILVIIDDLDRLDKDEIMSVLKLIRNSADFPNMVFVSAYDREYLNETLKDDVYKCSIYLEKIFQYQFKLPEYDKFKLKKMLYDEGIKIIKPEDEKEFKNVINDQWFGFKFDYIKSIRDVYRFLNAFNLVYERMHGEIVIKDLMNIELLRMKYNYVYELLAKAPFKYLFHDESDYLKLWSKSQTNSSSNNEDILEITKNKYTDNEDCKNIENMLRALFNQHTIQPSKNINNPFCIERYFYYSLLDSDISETEFKDVMKKTYDEIKPCIKDWVENNKSISLTNHIKKYTYGTIEECEKIIESIFYFGYISKTWYLDLDPILRHINFLPKNNKANKEATKKFLNNVFFENGASEFVAKFIKDLFYDLVITSTFIFTKEELNDISADMFKLLCVNETSFQTIYDLWENTLYFEHDLNSNGSTSLVEKKNEKANNLFIENIKLNYKTMLPQLINKDFEGRAFISKTYFDPWNGKEGFKSFIDELLTLNKDDKQLKEFSEFVTKYFKNQAAVQFDFKDIEIHL